MRGHSSALPTASATQIFFLHGICTLASPTLCISIREFERVSVFCLLRRHWQRKTSFARSRVGGKPIRHRGTDCQQKSNNTWCSIHDDCISDGRNATVLTMMIKVMMRCSCSSWCVVQRISDDEMLVERRKVRACFRDNHMKRHEMATPGTTGGTEWRTIGSSESI